MTIGVLLLLHRGVTMTIGARLLLAAEDLPHLTITIDRVIDRLEEARITMSEVHHPHPEAEWMTVGPTAEVMTGEVEDDHHPLRKNAIDNVDMTRDPLVVETIPTMIAITVVNLHLEVEDRTTIVGEIGVAVGEAIFIGN